MSDFDFDGIEKRHVKRHNVHFYIGVQQREGNIHLGHIIEISTAGMAMIGRNSIPPDTQLLLRLEASFDNGHKQIAELEAISTRVQKRERQDLFLTGFEFHNLSPKARLRIKNIIRQLEHAD